MISLSIRLSVIADMVPSCSVLADVGTDHGYLPVWLLQQGRVKHVFASDIHQGPLRKATETAELYGVSEWMETILADGLQFPNADQAEVITICGMGGETMISILDAAPWTVAQRRRLILQPQSKLAELERWLRENKFAIEDARLCIDGGIRYLALSVLGGAVWDHSAEDMLCLKQDPVFPNYVQNEIRKIKYALAGLQNSAKEHTDQINDLEQRISVLTQYEKEISKW